jgi:hypothetical protein
VILIFPNVRTRRAALFQTELLYHHFGTGESDWRRDLASPSFSLVQDDNRCANENRGRTLGYPASDIHSERVVLTAFLGAEPGRSGTYSTCPLSRTLEKTRLEILDGRSSFSCAVSGTLRSCALLTIIALHCRLSEQILHRPKLCRYHTRNPSSASRMIAVSVSKCLLQPNNIPFVVSTYLGSTPLSFAASYKAAETLSGMVCADWFTAWRLIFSLLPISLCETPLRSMSQTLSCRAVRYALCRLTKFDTKADYGGHCISHWLFRETEV